MMGRRWCFLCENPRGSQRSGWLWFHEECARRLMDNSGDLLWVMKHIKSGKFTKIEDVVEFLKKTKEFDEKMDRTVRFFNALKKNDGNGIRPTL